MYNAMLTLRDFPSFLYANMEDFMKSDLFQEFRAMCAEESVQSESEWFSPRTFITVSHVLFVFFLLNYVFLFHILIFYHYQLALLKTGNHLSYPIIYGQLNIHTSSYMHHSVHHLHAPWYLDSRNIFGNAAEWRSE